MRDFFKRHVIHNLGLKIVSVALAVGLWLAVSRDPVAEVAVTVPIEFQHIPGNLEISSETVPQAQIRIRGPERLVHRLQASDVHAEIDLAGTRPGERTFDLTGRQVHLPGELEVVQTIPTQVHISFDRRGTRQVEVRPRVVGQFAPGYEVQRVVADPSEVTISGPQKRIDAVESATTDPIDVSGTMERGTFVTHVYVPDPMVQVLHPESVRVTVIMEKKSAAPPAE
jgi:hypothetical protein